MGRAKPLLPRSQSFSDVDIAKMAQVVKNRHGVYALMIADYFANEQALLGDEVRAEAWERVVWRLHTEGYTQPPAC